ncbi:heme exporter protein CcmD [Camelimonas abortus]|uniref:Heme exporter protein D n=1 Tax=Camelimonas abortus TaxID=1017184 RepID=A0ABV7LD04_9HYPH
MAGGTDPYLGYVAAAYGAAFLALGGLTLWLAISARAVRREAAALEEQIARAGLARAGTESGT